jgi:hypothetical protein
MKCPECGEEMKGGYLQAIEGMMAWSEKRKRTPFYVGPPLPEELVGGDGWVATLIGFRCKRCRLFLVKEEEKQDAPYKDVNPFLTDIKKEV